MGKLAFAVKNHAYATKKLALAVNNHATATKMLAIAVQNVKKRPTSE